MHKQTIPWQSYWQDGNFDTFGKSFSDGNPVADALAVKLKEIALTNSEVQTLLDLGCGKGEHFQWLREMLPVQINQPLHIVGVDAAIPTMEIDSHTKIVKDNFESLSHVLQSEQCFDVVFAMFAAEYGQFNRILKALQLLHSGQLDCIFLMHTPGSIITEKTRHTLDFYRLFLNKDLDKALRKLKKTTNIKMFETTVLNNLNAVIGLKRSELMYDLHTVAERLQRLFSSINLSQKSKHVEQLLHYFEQLSMHKLRLEQQLAASKNSELLNGALADAGHHIKTDEILFNSYGEIGRFIHFVIQH
ncbi:class I SAM-dependent methyltransferase [Planctobacterium marinum]|uniref:class I SAM-dependent methyltransferase n=1 Tax=Planctobacterium marinum TaxID=1631968 RepID=UPI001E49FDA2|nr:class I SAM-dependent methyltransferase [Planctobacterium marinum]MCC2605520.1 class I SAM-dependent methyltransferase [Planctobacterium marinum]